MLMNDFYTISDVNLEARSLTGKISFNASHDIFKGHFPGQPVVPGVCMIQMIKEVLEQQLEKKTDLKNAPQVKFLQLITPDIQPIIHLQWNEDTEVISVNASFKTDRDLFKMNGNFSINK